MDIRTLYLTVGITYLVVPMGIYQASREDRDRQLILWCGSWALTGVGAVFIGLRGSIPDVLSYVCAHALIMLGYVLRINALLLELIDTRAAILRALRPRIVFAMLYLTIFSMAFSIGVNDMQRQTFVSAMQTLTFLDLLWIGIQMHQQRRSSGALMIIAMGALIALGFAVRSLGALTDAGGDGVFGFGVDQIIFLLFLLVGFIIGNLGFLQIRLEKLWLKNQRMMAQLSEADTLNRQLQELLQEKNAVLKKLAASTNAENAGVMVSAIAHELTQPLQALQLNAGYLHNKIEAQNPQDPSLGAIRDLVADAERLTEVINKIRRLFQRGEPNFGPVDPTGLLDNILSMLGPQLKGQGIELAKDMGSLGMVHGDQTQLQMALTNIIRNAIEALSQKTGPRSLEIRGQTNAGHIEIDIADNGPGIDPAMQRRLFSLYDSTKDTGSGVGLWLARVVIQNHRGTLTHHNAPGGGARFRISLPMPTAG